MRVLLAVDHSQASDAAVTFLAQQEFAEPVDLDLISVISPLHFVDMSGGDVMGLGMTPEVHEFIAEEQRLVEEVLDGTVAKLQGRFRSVQRIVKIGSPDTEIRHFADSRKVDLVVLGAVGHSSVSRILLGSVSDYVATHVRGSVLVYRKKDIPGDNVTPKRVLLAIGGSDHDAGLVERLSLFRFPVSTEICIVHVSQLLTFFRQDLRQRFTDSWQKARQHAMNRLGSLEKVLKERGFRVSTDLLSETHIGEALVIYSQKKECDLILTCNQNNSLLDRMILGSTSRYVLRHAHCSVMIVRPHAVE